MKIGPSTYLHVAKVQLRLSIFHEENVGEVYFTHFNTLFSHSNYSPSSQLQVLKNINGCTKPYQRNSTFGLYPVFQIKVSQVCPTC